MKMSQDILHMISIVAKLIYQIYDVFSKKVFWFIKDVHIISRFLLGFLSGQELHFVQVDPDKRKRVSTIFLGILQIMLQNILVLERVWQTSHLFTRNANFSSYTNITVRTL